MNNPRTKTMSKFFIISVIIYGQWSVAATDPKILSKSLIPKTSIHVDLSKKNFSTIANETFHDRNDIVSLNLAGNHMRELPERAFSGLKNLTKLDLSENCLQNTSKLFVDLKNLRELDISYNFMDILGPNYLRGITNRCVVKIENDISNLRISGEVFGVDGSTTSTRKVTKRRNVIGYLKLLSSSWKSTGFQYKLCSRNSTLVQLNIWNDNNDKPSNGCYVANRVQSKLRIDMLMMSKVEKNWYRVPENVAMSVNMCEITLARVRSDKLLSDLVSELPIYFKKVIVEYGPSTQLTKGTFGHKGVVELSIVKFGIIAIEPGTFDTPKLKILHLRRNQINDIDSLRNLPPTVETLNLINCDIVAIKSNSFSHLKNLKRLSLASNKIVVVQPGAFERVDSLKVLSLGYNRITDVNLGTLDMVDVKSLDLRNNLLRNVTLLSTLPTSINILYLESNAITEIKINSFSRLKNLRQIYLDANKITNIELGAFRSIKNLEILSVRSNKITDIVLDFNVQTLDLRNNKLRNVTSFNGTTQTIEKIKLESNFISKITVNTFSHVKKLSELYLDKNNISTIEVGAFKNLRNLKLLSLQNNRMTRIEPGTLEMLNVEILWLNNNRLTDIGSLPSTTEILHLESNEITALTARSFLNLKKLKELHLNDNKISTVEIDSFKNLNNLKILHLRKNRIDRIKSGTFDMLNVTTLDLHNNRIQSIDSLPPTVKILFLSSNAITTITTRTFANSKNLSELYLNENKIFTIKAGALEHLRNVTYINLSDNQITRLEAGIFTGLQNLKTLLLTHNSLERLNAGALDLPELESLDVSYNVIRIIEKGALKKTRELCWLDIQNNPIHKLENGQLFGFRKTSSCYVNADGARIRTLEGGMFDDV